MKNNYTSFIPVFNLNLHCNLPIFKLTPINFFLIQSKTSISLDFFIITLHHHLHPPSSPSSNLIKKIYRSRWRSSSKVRNKSGNWFIFLCNNKFVYCFAYKLSKFDISCKKQKRRWNEKVLRKKNNSIIKINTILPSDYKY